ncbi:MAG: hypothetical protein HY712_00910 [candidate division NC10 bacterium]|nr:hypothetical protein [candidate division NC10 bacterium]
MDAGTRERFSDACIEGLLSRLEAKDDKEKFLRELIPELQRRFERGITGGAVYRILRHAKPARKNERPSCKPGLLLYHYALAEKLLRGILVSNRQAAKRADALVKYADALNTRLNEEYRCDDCGRKTIPPDDFREWALRKHTEREIILKLLAYHHHGFSPDSLRRLLDKAAQQNRPLR